MNSIYDELEELLRRHQPIQAVERLCQALREREDYHALFYALVLAKRVELGLPAVHIGSENIPAEKLGPYEDAIREAARTVGRLFLERNDLASAWPYFRMIGEHEPMVAAIERIEPTQDEAAQQAIEIGFHEGVHPRRGFDLLLARYGICSAITALGQAFHMPQDVRDHCVKRLIRALHTELRERLKAELADRGEQFAEDIPIPELIQRLNWPEGEEFYHVDVSHLGAVTQYSLQLPPCEELELALDLCLYGERLSPRFRYHTDPPFEDQYRDYAIYLKVLLGRDVEAGIEHFRAKAEAADPENVGTYPAQVLVTLLDRIGRTREAIAAYCRYLAQADQRHLSCPPLVEMCQRVGDYAPLVDVALRRGDLVNYTAGLIQMQKS
ncbi:MAG: hypothetical protein NZM31_12160 [Gemmatales bacterium]|nr:hypothetical protein [Gemmatales bacterium]MDW8387749.1 hypothetical protein [Gemmatales bacterium]